MRFSDAWDSMQGFADVDPWLDGTLRFGGGYSTWSPPSSPVMAEVRPSKHVCSCTGKCTHRLSDCDSCVRLCDVWFQMWQNPDDSLTGFVSLYHSPCALPGMSCIILWS